MPSYTRTQTLSDGTIDGAAGGTKVSTDEVKAELRLSVAAGATDYTSPIPDLAYAKTTMLWISGAGNDEAVVVETNSGSSPGHTFTIPAGGGVAVNWASGEGTTPLATTDVSAWYFTNPGTTACAVVIAALLQAP